MIDVITINFHDSDTSESASVIVRQASDRVALAISLATNGDIEVTMPKAVAAKLAQALQQATK